ncbi:MAG: hypothetical protein P0116_02380 [Candidatus Nitrosocosmicus sp.]|nr:hypothetical protein [Candidatus Nitrosocosmicus sp.]
MKFTSFVSFLVSIIMLFSVFTSPLNFNKAYAHIFISDDDVSSFLTLLERVRVEALMANNTLSQNITNSQEHYSRLIDSIDDISDSENDFEISSKQFDNSTVNALLFANLIDEVLRNYGMSYGIVPSVMTNMSYMSSNLMNTVNKSGSLIDIDKYMISKEYAKRALEIYDSTLRIFENKNNKNSLNNIGEDLMDLSYSIKNRTDPFEIMSIVHTKLHPSLQAAFNLTLNP